MYNMGIWALSHLILLQPYEEGYIIIPSYSG